MKQHHLAANHSKYHSKYSSFKMAANFPQVLFHLAHQWHTQRPAKLNLFDICANDLSIFRR